MKWTRTPPPWATHSGWFGLCPVFLDARSWDIDEWRIEPRSALVAWLVPLSICAWKVGKWLGYPLPFPIRIRKIL